LCTNRHTKKDKKQNKRKFWGNGGKNCINKNETKTLNNLNRRKRVCNNTTNLKKEEKYRWAKRRQYRKKNSLNRIQLYQLIHIK
jgi:hypothetical protein